MRRLRRHFVSPWLRTWCSYGRNTIEARILVIEYKASCCATIQYSYNFLKPLNPLIPKFYSLIFPKLLQSARAKALTWKMANRNVATNVRKLLTKYKSKLTHKALHPIWYTAFRFGVSATIFHRAEGQDIRILFAMFLKFNYAMKLSANNK
jgi:hypothetical protein